MKLGLLVWGWLSITSSCSPDSETLFPSRNIKALIIIGDSYVLPAPETANRSKALNPQFLQV